MTSSRSRPLLIVLSSTLLAGCGSSPAGPPSTTLVGVMAGINATSGSLTITIAANSALSAPSPGGVVQASGVWTEAGAAVNLAGSYDTAAKNLALSGIRNGVTYSFASISQTATSMDGDVTWTGAGMAVFTAFVAGPGVVVTTQCGAYAPAGALAGGPFNLVLSSDGAAACVLFANTIPQKFQLTRSGASLSGINVNGTVSPVGDAATGTFVQSPYDTTWSTGFTGC